MISEVCDWIIIIGGVVAAITQIYKAIAKPAEKVKKKMNEELGETLELKVNEIVPSILKEHDALVDSRFRAERQNIIDQLRTEIFRQYKEDLSMLKAADENQNQFIDALMKSSKDMLRQRIMTIYHRYKSTKKMPIYEREALNELYKDYKSENGNSYIDKYYRRMDTWEVYDDETDM